MQTRCCSKEATFLIQHNPCYQDMEIDMDVLNDLPEDGNISDWIPRIVHVVPPPNALSETREGRSTVEGDENEDGEDREDDDLEEGLDTSGATGPIDNEDVSSSRGKTMCPTLNLLLLAG